MTKKKLTTLWLPSWYPTPNDPTLGIFTRRDAEALSMFCNVILVYAIEAEGSDYELNKTTVSPSFTEILIFYPTGSRLTKLVRFLRAYKKGFRKLEIDNVTPDILHLHVIWPASIVVLFNYRLLYLPLFISEHWSGYKLKDKSLNGWRIWLAKYLIKKGVLVFAVSDEIVNAMKDMGMQGRYLKNPNVVKFYSFNKRRKVHPKFKFVHVSSLKDVYKNIYGILRAVRSLSKKRQDFEFVFIGGDNGTKHYEIFVANSDLEQFVKFKGVLRHEDVMEELADSDAFVLFSNHEGLPCVLLEAMSVGVPVISTAIPGLEDWVGPGQGVLIPIGDEPALVAAMNDMMENHARYIPEMVSEKVIRECNYEVVGNRIYQEYLRASGGIKEG